MTDTLKTSSEVKFDYETARFSLRLRVSCERAVKAVWSAVDLGVWSGKGVAADVARSFAMGDMGLILCNAKIRGRLESIGSKDKSESVVFFEKMNACLTSLVDAKLSEGSEPSQFDRLIWLTKAESILDDVEDVLSEVREKREKSADFVKTKH